jgi:L-alanine-DL-glutamate epimerase-like enolase superfamily enzyme
MNNKYVNIEHQFYPPCQGQSPQQAIPNPLFPTAKASGFYRASHKGTYLKNSPAISGIEIACWDILGKTLNAPIWQLLGGKTNSKLRVYANGWYQGPRDPSFFVEAAAKVVEMGYTALKFDPFGSAYRFLNRSEARRSIAIVRAVRDAVARMLTS